MHTLNQTTPCRWSISDGVVQPFNELDWRKWMYRVSPYTYIIEGLLGQAIGGDSIKCSSTKLVSVNHRRARCVTTTWALHRIRRRLSH
ncbi:uncharacterized protein F5891DRAFT_998676 [Suillus fuscotomentosus]|uniref:Uncharacterized protein n=1 Tax=Suillus fuscotomentosus TaxID=1912939 RepID=A0AAD4HTR7_9AGAM|nr:uncharacterized protein F5891DRAFT_998676 [Suillus fuscotomentosus]KAG1908066.1 hypothetical protein F5891DRAFT_998676 [Suillus fuscotomentosus]